MKAWFSDDDPFTLDGLLIKEDSEKEKHGNRIAYQCAEEEDGPCGRTFEDAFILANRALFGLNGATREELEEGARSQASKIKKSEFALRYAIEEKAWTTPKYILDGIRWLGAGIEPTVPDPALALAAEAMIANEEDAADA